MSNQQPQSMVIGGEAGTRLDESQLQVLDLARGLGQRAGLQVIGAPRTGKTLLAMRILAANHREAAGSALILAPNRHAAGAIKSRMHRFLPDVVEGTLVHTPASLAYSVIAREALAAGESAPRLLTGAEQDELIADLLAGHAADGIDLGWGRHLDSQTRSLQGFRDELRDFLNTLTALGVVPEQLEGYSINNQQWLAIAKFYREYMQIKSIRYPGAYDSQELMTRASAVLVKQPEAASAQLRTIIVDDAQATTLSIKPLLGALRTRLITFGDPDATVNQFEGGQSHQAINLHKLAGITEVSHSVLRHAYHVPEHIAVAARAVVDSIGVDTEFSQRQVFPSSSSTARDNTARDNTAEQADNQRLYMVGENDTALLRKVAGFLRRRHFQDGVAWSNMAVVSRTSGLATVASDVLGSMSVPAKHHKAMVPAFEDASRALLDAAAIVSANEDATFAEISGIATSYLGNGVSQADLRSLKRQLRVLEVQDGGHRTGDQLIENWFATGAQDLLHSGRLPQQRFQKLCDALAHARSEVDAGVNAHAVIWGIWDRAHVAAKWQRSVLADSPTAALDARALDAVIALMKNAERFVEQSSDGSTRAWVQKMRSQSIPEDVLQPGVSDAGVFLGTPSALVGTEFDTVIIIGLQEGQWPNLRIRNSLLGANDLAQIVDPNRVQAQSREDVLHDELRLLYYAVTRATNTLAIGVVEGQDAGPSAFAGLISPTQQITHTDVLPSIREYTGTMRRQLLAAHHGVSPHPTASITQAAAALHELADHGVAGAAPDSWYGLMPSSSVSGRADELVFLTPSTLESLESCPLAWTIKHIGGSVSTAATSVGTLVHKALEEHTKHGADMQSVVDEHWHEIEFAAPFEGENTYTRITAAVEKLSAYLAKHELSIKASELRFEFTLAAGIYEGVSAPEVRVRGSIDRLDLGQDDDGRRVVRVTDLKTSRQAAPKDEAKTNAQLTCYLMAIGEDAFAGVEQDAYNDAAVAAVSPSDVTIASGALVYPATTAKSATAHERPAFSAPDATPAAADDAADTFDHAKARIAKAATEVVGASVTAHVGSHCSHAGEQHGPFGAAECAAQLRQAICYWEPTEEGK